MKRQNILFALLLGLSLIGCDDNGERASMALYQRALQSMENKQFSLAKLQADSIKTLYPKAFSVRADALRLLLRIDYAESQLGQSYTDSLLVVNRERVAHLVEDLYLDKDVRYQDVGTYYAPGHRSEKNAGRTYIRPQVDERGVHSIVAFRCGAAVEAHTLRFTAPDATYVEVKATSEPYQMSDASGRTERTDFTPSPLGCVGSFLSLNKGNDIKVTLVGNKGTVSIPFTKADAAAFLQVYELAMALNSINELEKQHDDLTRRIDFLVRRMQSDSISQPE